MGTITDSTGASVPGASIMVTDVNTAVVHTLLTDAGGYYSAPDLPPGTYKVSAQKDGFETSVHSGITLFVDNTVRVDATLAPGAITQTVNVTSEVTPALQTDTASTGRDIDTAPVSQLPLSTGRNFQSLLNTVPGASFAVKDHSTFFNPQLSMASAVNGNSGSALGAVTNVILKSGTNAFHGEVYYFYTGNALQARTYFQTTPNHHAVDNYWGGNLGGPIQKGKMFFFASFLDHTQHLGEFYPVNVPTMAMRSGDFSDPTLAAIYDPTTGDTVDCLPGGIAKLCGTGRQQFSYNGILNVIPPDRLDPVALKLLAYVPAPNAN